MVYGLYLNLDLSVFIYDYVDMVCEVGVFDEVWIGFWKEELFICEVFWIVEVDEVYVVLFFISEGYFME